MLKILVLVFFPLLSFCHENQNECKHIHDVKFTRIQQGKYCISWEKDPSPTAEYWIFGSNSQDFEPSIYLETGSNDLLTITSANSIEVDDFFAFYRIISVDNQKPSLPSPLISVFDEQTSPTCAVYDVKNYAFHPYISQATWNLVKPYLLPDNHPIRSALNQIFTRGRVSQSIETLEMAGFKTKGGPNNHSKTIFGRHKDLKGYVVKVIPDDFDANEVERLLSRIIGAKTAQYLIDKHGYNHLIKVPKKWLYVLPPEPSPIPGTIRKNFILVAEDMDIYEKKEDNYPIWKSFLMTKELLHAIYTVITLGGFNDSVYAFNLPFSKDGKIAMIDTEDHHKWPIPYHTLRKYLPTELQHYWDELTTPK